MRHQKSTNENSPSYHQKLLGAISRMLAADTEKEREQIIAENPILLSPKAVELIDRVIADFDENVTIVDDFPEEWKRLRKFLGKRQKKNLHETDA